MQCRHTVRLRVNPGRDPRAAKWGARVVGRSHVVKIKPRTIGLEATSLCQLQCPTCPTATGATRAALGRGYLRARDFENLLDASPWVRTVELSNYGEMFLNPDLLRIMNAAQERGVTLTANNGVNLNSAKDEVLEGLVVHRFLSLTCSIDGAGAETYGAYRRGGDFETVIENIRRINAHKQRLQSAYPKLVWQFVVFGHNEHEIAGAREMATELGMKFYLKLSRDNSFSPIRDKAAARREVGLDSVSREEYEQKYQVDYMRESCHQLWVSPQINWDGKVLGCCQNFWGDFGGNAFVDGLQESLEHEKIHNAREMLLGRREPLDGIPCTTCDHYQTMRDRGNWISMREIRMHQKLGRLAFHIRQPALVAHRLAARIRNLARRGSSP